MLGHPYYIEITNNINIAINFKNYYCVVSIILMIPHQQQQSLLTFRISHLKDFKMQLVLKIVKQIPSEFVLSLQSDLLYFPLMIIC